MRRDAATTRRFYAQLEQDLKPKEADVGVRETAKTVTVIAICVLALALFLFTGCSVQQPSPVVPPPPAPVVEAPPSPAPAVIPEVVTAPIHREPPPPLEELRPVRETRLANGVPFTLGPGRKYTVRCPQWGVVTLVFPEGEQVRAISSGNSEEWQIQGTETGREITSFVATIRRTPEAPDTEMHVVMDAATYQFILKPGGELGEKRPSLITFTDPQAQQRRARLAAERARRAAEQRQQQEQKSACRGWNLPGYDPMTCTEAQQTVRGK